MIDSIWLSAWISEYNAYIPPRFLRILVGPHRGMNSVPRMIDKVFLE
jgi:hypothetical protein